MWALTLGALPSPSMGAAVLVALLVSVVGALYAYVTRHFSYWRRRGVPFLPPLPFVGNFKDVVLFRKHIAEVLLEIYSQMKEQPYVGLFLFDQPVLYLKDVGLFREMLNKDFEYFQDRGFTPSKSDSLFSESLFARKEKDWKDLRFKLNPAFTVGKLKRFFDLLEQKAANLDHYFDDAAREGVACDVTNACARYGMDAIATVGFGIETTAITDDNDPLHRVLRRIFVYNKILTLVSLATFVRMPLVRLLGVSLVPAPLAAFLRRTVWAAARERLRAGTAGERKDFLDLLLELRDKGRIAGDDEPSDDGLHDAHAAKGGPELKSNINMDGDVLISQAFSMFSAGFETTSSTMSYSLYHIAKDENIQNRVRTLLQKAIMEHGGKLTYEALQSVEYLDMIVSETVRLYPAIPFLDRTCTKTYNIPGSDIVIEKGVVVFASLIGIQRDPLYFPDPERFDPERFSADNKTNISIGSYVPFGVGPRKCIGMRLAYLQSKLGLAHLILNYKFQPCSETPSKVEFNVHSFLTSPSNGILLKLTRIE